MEQENKILFWFREHLSIENNGGLSQAIQCGSEIIPVFCFDPRETELARSSNNLKKFLDEQVQRIEKLRKELQLRGSNLLVVNEPYETIIPSLARVLKVSKVFTDQLVMSELSHLPELIFFRNQKAAEVFRLLNMHSIPMVLTDLVKHQNTIPTTFPRFPEINPGLIPQL